MDVQIPPIKIAYQGGDADNNLLELGQLGQSIQGAAKLLGAAANVVLTGQYAKKSATFAVRVMATPATAGSFEIVATFASVAPVVAPFLPTLGDILSDASKRAVEGITNYAIAKFAKNPAAADSAYGVLEAAFKEMGHTSRTAIEAIERVALNNGPAVRQFVAPVGLSCKTAQIGEVSNGGLAIDLNTRLEIDAAESIEIGPAAPYEILITELDLKNRSCKFRLWGDDDPEQRISGEITDPQIATPRNPYSAAMDGQVWIIVTGKPHLRDGEIERLYISDVIRSVVLSG